MTDVFTKSTKAVATRDKRASTVTLCLIQEWFHHYGVPDRIHSDQGRDFESDIIKQVCKLYEIQKTRTTAYHPETARQSVLTERYTIYVEPYHQRRRNTGQIIYRMLLSRTMCRLFPALDIAHFTCFSAVSLKFLWV